MEIGVLSLALVALMCMIKIIPGALVCIFCGVDFWQQWLSTFTGGMLGVIVFAYFGEGIRALWRKIRQKPIDAAVAKAPNERFQRLWRRYGLLGAAFLTPPLLSPPGGAMLAVSFGTPKLKMMLYYAVSIAVWTFVFAAMGKSFAHLMTALGMSAPDCSFLTRF